MCAEMVGLTWGIWTIAAVGEDDCQSQHHDGCLGRADGVCEDMVASRLGVAVSNACAKNDISW